MSDENDSDTVLASQVLMHDPDRRLKEEVASLRQQLASLQRDNVVQGGFRGEAPRYSLNEPGFYDDTWFPAGSVIDYIDAPNLSMVPLNDPAKRAMTEHISQLEHGARTKAAMAGREYFGQVNDRNVLIDLARQDAKAQAAQVPPPVIQMPIAHGQVPAMPHIDSEMANERRGRGRPRKVVASSEPGSNAAPDRGAPVLAPAIVGRQVG